MMIVIGILGSFVCVVAFVALAAIASDAAGQGRRGLAVGFALAAGLAILGVNACMDAVDRAYHESVFDGR